MMFVKDVNPNSGNCFQNATKLLDELRSASKNNFNDCLKSNLVTADSTIVSIENLIAVSHKFLFKYYYYYCCFCYFN